ncbi:MAG: hypothetical protein ABI220_01370 [Candidatus Saccharimonadales bacterium]
MNIYVAARFTEKALVQDLYAKLIAKGHTITADWTKHQNVKPYNEHPDEAGTYSKEDLDGVIKSDVFIYLSSPEVGAGLSTELGAALASFIQIGKPKIYVVGKFVSTNAFHYHPAVIRVTDIRSALKLL